MNIVLDVVQILILLVAAPLIGLYWRERVKNIAREASERALADHHHQHELLLAQLNVEHQRRLQEFGLYTRKQHSVYAALYRQVREAADRYRGMTGLTMEPDFLRFSIPDVREYAAQRHIADHEVGAAIDAYTAGNSGVGARVMSELHFRANARDAARAFRKAKNTEALYELYLSDDVRAQMTVVRQELASFSATLQTYEEDHHQHSYPLSQRIEEAVISLSRIMRSELQRGSQQVASGPAA